MSTGILTILIFLFMFSIIFLGLPVAFAMALSGFLGFAYTVGLEAATNMLAVDFLNVFTSYGLSAIAMFVLMGEIAVAGGIGERLFAVGYTLFGRMRGGLCIATVVACAFFAAICGSTAATAAAMGAIVLPLMRKYNYDDALSGGTVASGGTLGILIPPSSTLIVYGFITEQPVGKLFVAGIIPGIILGILFVLTVAIQCNLNPALGPAGPETSLKKKIISLVGLSETVIVFLFVIGGLFTGLFTPSQAGAAGSGALLVVGLARGKFTLRGFLQALKRTVGISTFILTLMAGGMILGRFVAVTNLPFIISDTIADFSIPPVVALMLIFGIHFIGGCIMDAFAMIVLTLPVFFPVIVDLGFDPIWYGIMIVLWVEMAAITPPIGLNVYVIKGIIADIPIHTVFKGIIPFVIALVLCAFLMLAFPKLVTFLPSIMTY